MFRLAGCLSYLFVFSLVSLRVVHSTDDGGEVQGCAESEIAFGCKDEGDVVLVKEAKVHRIAHLNHGQSRCRVPEYLMQFGKTEDLLQQFNKQCVTKRECRFNALDDIIGAKDDLRRWKNSVISLQYECVPKSRMFRSCGLTIRDQQGWLQNIGYPSYYLGPGDCTITIALDVGQRVELTLFDLSIRDIIRPSETNCTDRISVTEHSRRLISTCGELKNPITVTSVLNVLNVTLHTSKDVFPKRGFMAKFKNIGCPMPTAPYGGNITFRNASHAHFKCHANLVFYPFMSRSWTLICDEKLGTWVDNVPDCSVTWNAENLTCVDLDELLAGGNITETEYMFYNSTKKWIPISAGKGSILVDIVVPGVLMAGLIIGNVLIFYLILMCRKRISSANDDFDDLDSIKANQEPTDVSEKLCDV